MCIYAVAVWSLTANLGISKSFPWSTGPLSNWLVWLGLALVANFGAVSRPSNSRPNESRLSAPAVPRIGGALTASCSRAACLWRELRVARRIVFGIAAIVAVTSSREVRASEPDEIVSVTSPPALTFARYIAYLNQRDVFTESGPVALEVTAEIPLQHTHASFSAVRETGTSERSEYEVVRVDGDGKLLRALIQRYLTARAQAEDVPLSSILISPANYKFRYIGSRYSFGSLVYIFQIKPRRARAGLIKGQLWIDSDTGVPLRQTGRFVKMPSRLLRRLDVTCDASLQDGTPYLRTTYAVIDAGRPVGRARLKITERPLEVDEEQPPSLGQLARWER